MKTQDFPEKIRVKLGNRIREERKKVGMTQLEVAKALGVSQSLISEWEKGNAVPLAINIFQLTALFQTSPLVFNPLEEVVDFEAPSTNESELDIQKEIDKIWQAIQRLEANTTTS